jgi:hypothetical protein
MTAAWIKKNQFLTMFDILNYLTNWIEIHFNTTCFHLFSYNATASLIKEDSLGVSLELLLSSLASSDSLFSIRFAIASASFFLVSASFLAFCAF